MHDTIAIIFDFDDTLAPDSTSGYLKQAGIKDIKKFWKSDVEALITESWDPVPAYLYQMILSSKQGLTSKPISRESLIAWGKKLPLHDGVSKMFERLRAISKGINPHVNIEYYLISSGIGDILRNTSIAKEFKDIWASEFHYDEKGNIAIPKRIVSFTDKTRYIFHIQKGIVGPAFQNKPFEVNKKLKPEQIRVPIKNMIFVGDGYTDIPCFSLVRKNEGVAIAVYDKNQDEKWGNAYQFSSDNRVSNINVADYSENSELSIYLSMAVKQKATDILINKGTYQG